MGIAACVADECGEAIEYANSLTTQAHVKYFSVLWTHNRGSYKHVINGTF